MRVTKRQLRRLVREERAKLTRGRAINEMYSPGPEERRARRAIDQIVTDFLESDESDPALIAEILREIADDVDGM
jgi:hypothetical protein